MSNSESPKWEVMGGNQTVIAFTEKRPTYESKRDWEKAFRKKIQDALRVLVADEGEMLVAKYGSVNNDPIDTENAVFYNFAAPVSQSARYGVSFKTLLPNDVYATFDLLGKQGYNYLYIYSIEKIAPASSEEVVIQPFVRWTDVPVKTMRIENAEFYFSAIRKNPECVMVCSRGQINGDFGLNIRIRSSEKEPFRLTTPMKPILDGIISSFHKLPSDVSVDEIINNVNDFLIKRETWKQMFLDEQNSVLPPHQYVRPYRRNSLQWSPMDEHCKEACITIEYGAEKWSFSGELYEVAGE
jgi:hypothetical protein